MNYKNKAKELYKQVDWVLLLEMFIISVVIVPILLISLYSLPSADDFYNAYIMKMDMSNKHSYIKVMLNQIFTFYKTGGGYTFATFLNLVFTPLLHGGIKAIRGFVLVVNAFFYFSLYCLIDKLLVLTYKIKKKLILAIYILILTAFTNNYINAEIMTWYCVVSQYVLTVACMFWGIIFLLKALQSNRIFWTVTASLTGFLVSGGTLNITALNCGIYLIIGYMGIKIYRRKSTAIICFGSSLLGGIINALSPGNFSRHDSISSEYSIGGAIKSAAFMGWSRFQYLFFYTPFILLLVVLFILAFKYIDYKGNFKYNNPFLLLCIVLLGVVIVNFPVCLGYSNGSFPDRCVWVEDCCTYLGIFSWIIYFVGWIKNRFGEVEMKW